MNRLPLSATSHDATCQKTPEDCCNKRFEGTFDLDAELERECRIDYLPSPVEIVSGCRQIRSRWSCSERRRRLVGESPYDGDVTWQPPLIDTSLLRAISANKGDVAG